MSYSIAEYIELIVWCVAIFVTGNAGIYLIAKTSSIKNILWRSSFIYGLGLYWFSNYFQLIFLVPSFFVDIYYDFFEFYINYTHAALCLQHLLLLSMSLGRLIPMCQRQFVPSSMCLTSLLYLIFFFISIAYGAALCVIPRSNIQRIVSLAYVLVNLVSCIVSLVTVIVSSCCVKNVEKRQQMNYAWITLFISAIFVGEYAAAIIIGIGNRDLSSGYFYSNSIIRTLGLIGSICDLVSLLGSCIIFVILW